ncbi:MAG TPA: flagellar biosynthetic protein FliO [Planctomycetota bacterium]|jgi:flagellar biogenesis protein FliO|nr:flagellar biosynthetic protein FliO [Planctomycetota bacterium]
MAFAWPLARHDFGAGARSLLTRGAWLRAVLPAALVCAGALLLAPPWRKAPPEAAPEKPVAAPASPLLPAGGDPATLVGALLVVGGALALLPAILSRLQSHKRGGLIDLVEVRPLGGRSSLMLVQVGGRRILVGASEHGMAALAELDPAPSFAEVARAERDGGGGRG